MSVWDREGDRRIKGEGGRRRYCSTQEKKEIEIYYKIYKISCNWNNFFSFQKKSLVLRQELMCKRSNTDYSLLSHHNGNRNSERRRTLLITSLWLIYCYCSLVHVIHFAISRLANYGIPLYEKLNLKWINEGEASGCFLNWRPWRSVNPQSFIN